MQPTASSGEGTQKLSQLFVERPRQWNLRGDPWLWQDLEQCIDAAKPVANADEFVAWLEAEIERLVGVPISHSEIVFVKNCEEICPRRHVQRLCQSQVLAGNVVAFAQGKV